MKYSALSNVKKYSIMALVCVSLVLVVLGGCQTANTTPISSAISNTPTASPSLPAGVKPLNNQLVTATQAKALIAENQGSADFVIVDVRTPEEYASGHLANAINIDLEDKSFDSNIATLDKNKKYLVYCRSGRRSAEAAGKMVDIGIYNVYDLSGGITQWTAEGNPVV